MNATISPFIGVIVLALINIGSTVAFQATISLTVCALFSSYFVSIGCIALKRLRREPLPNARWSLGRFGIFINLFAVAFLAFIVFFSFFPTQTQFEADKFNWSIVIYGGIIILSTLYYVTGGKNTYHAPVELVKNE